MDKENMTFYSLLFDEEIYLIDEGGSAATPTKEKEIPLVEEPVVASDSTDEVFSDVIYLGNNASKLCILVEYPGEEWIIVRDRLFLEKILLSVQISFDKAALINIAGYKNKRFSDIQKRLPSNNFIGFGLSVSFTEGMPCDVMFQKEACKIIFTSSNLMDIAMDKNKKSVLWKNLKEMFEL